jgi:hypothetical protein
MSSSVLIRHRGLVMNPDESCAEWRGHAVGLTAIPRRQEYRYQYFVLCPLSRPSTLFVPMPRR